MIQQTDCAQRSVPRSQKRNLRKEHLLRDPDVGAGSDRVLLCLANIGPALDQFRGSPVGNWGGRVSLRVQPAEVSMPSGFPRGTLPALRDVITGLIESVAHARPQELFRNSKASDSSMNGEAGVALAASAISRHLR
jgi:hypothetical protein